jgi:hypothetical protein
VGGISVHYASISHVPSCFCRAVAKIFKGNNLQHVPWCKTTFKEQNRSKLVDNVREIVIENYEEDKILRNRKESEQVDLK